MFQVVILNSRIENERPVIFEGTCQSVFLPGDEGEFEILDFHKPIITKLKKGLIVVDNKAELYIQGGIVKMNRQRLLAVVDL